MSRKKWDEPEDQVDEAGEQAPAKLVEGKMGVKASPRAPAPLEGPIPKEEFSEGCAISWRDSTIIGASGKVYEPNIDKEHLLGFLAKMRNKNIRDA